MIYYDETRCLIVQVCDWTMKGVRIDETDPTEVMTLWVGTSSPIPTPEGKMVDAQGVAIYDTTKEEWEANKDKIGVPISDFRPRVMLTFTSSSYLEWFIDVLQQGVTKLKEQGR
jgi:hypothetical protein